jgi:hypothetical protein
MDEVAADICEIYKLQVTGLCTDEPLLREVIELEFCIMQSEDYEADIK